MSFTQPHTKPCALKITHQNLSRTEAEARWADLIQSGFSGWGQWTARVASLTAGGGLPQGCGALLAGECYRGAESYRIQHIGGSYSLVCYQHSEGDTHLALERSFVTIGAGGSGAGGSGARYLVYWEATPKTLQGAQFFDPLCRQVGPIAARLVQLSH